MIRAGRDARSIGRALGQPARRPCRGRPEAVRAGPGNDRGEAAWPLLLENGEGPGGDLFHRARARDPVIGRRGRVAAFRPSGVVLDEGAGLLVIDRQALANGFLAVVLALDERLAGLVVAALHLGRVEANVVGATTRGMDAAA